MAIFRAIETIESSLPTIPVKHGQVIYCTDSGDIFTDGKMGRVKMGDIITLDTEEERESLLAPLNDKLYVVIETSNLYRYNGDKWFCLSNNNTITITKKNYTITANATSIPIGVSGFDKTKDSLMVFLNSVFLDEGTDYTINSNNTSILPPSGGNWEGTTQSPSHFSFVIFKNIPVSSTLSATYALENNANSYEQEIQSYKQENALLIYTMMINKLDMSPILNYNKFKELYSHNLWTDTMFNKAIELGKLTSTQYQQLKL